MFKKNTKHQQPAIISAASELPEKQRKRLESSWAGTFYNQFFCRIKEETFAVLYSDIPSRPNVAVNVLIGLEALKAGYGWSDQELYENYCYNLQVRYALGYDRLGDGDFEIRTLYYFRERLSRYNAEQGINLLEKAFEQITDAQIMDLKVHTGMQRMDSTQIASNIVFASRLQLMVETFQRVERILSAADKARLADMLAPYMQDSAGHYTYRVKGTERYRHICSKSDGQSILFCWN
ncbi:MAG: transposase [Pelolinea sp.]|nr:transposase [Pelolinea sp.]